MAALDSTRQLAGGLQLSPRNVDAERSVLGALLLDKDQIGVVVGKLEADDFYLAAHADVFRAMLQLSSKQIPIDTLTLADELERQGSLARVGGLEVITSLAASVPTTANVEHYADIVKNHSDKRRVISAAGKLADLGFDEHTDAGTALVEAQRIVSEAAGDRKAGHRLNVIQLCEVADEPLPPDLIEGVLPDRFPSSMFGGGGNLKSLLALQAGICIASDLPFLGRSVVQGHVLYIDWELNAEVTAWRARKLAAGLRLEDVPQGLHYLNANRPLAGLLNDLQQVVIDQGIRLVIIDSLGLAIACDTQSEQFVIPAMGSLRALGCASLVIDHQGHLQQGQEYASKEAYGSVYKGNLVRASWQLERAESGTDINTVDLVMRHRKHTFGPLLDKPLGVRVTFGPTAIEVVAFDAASSPGLASKLPARDQVFVALVSEPGSTAEAISDSTGMVIKTVKNSLTELKAAGRVTSKSASGREAATWYPTSPRFERPDRDTERPDRDAGGERPDVPPPKGGGGTRRDARFTPSQQGQNRDGRPSIGEKADVPDDDVATPDAPPKAAVSTLAELVKAAPRVRL